MSFKYYYIFINSYHCFCDNSYPLIQVAEDQCNMNCTGNATQNCGSIYRNSLYCLNPPCNTKTQQRIIGSSGSWTLGQQNLTISLTTDGQNKPGQISLTCSSISTVGLRVNYSNGQSIETNFANDMASMSSLRNMKIDFTNKKLSGLNDKLQICVQDLLTTIITCSGCDSSAASYTFFVSSLNVSQLTAYYDKLGSTFYSLKQFGVSWQGKYLYI